MTEQEQPKLDRLDELLADRALFGLDGAEQAELEELLRQSGREDDESFERTAAAAQLAGLGSVQPMPDALSAKLVEAGVRMVGAEGEKPLADAPSLVTKSNEPGRRELLAWFAAAASLTFAWFATLDERVVEEASLSPADLHAQILAEAEAGSSQVTMAEWSPGGDPTGASASGDVVWHDGLQQGVMRFRDLAANDPSKEQYQLWIFDVNQDDRHPIDGGVFDVPAEGGDVFVEIDAKLPVTRAKLFAVTVEKPGGVVVSSRERLPLLATPPKQPAR